MLIQFITTNLWYALALWIVLYCLDYALTLVGARLFRRNAGAFVLMDNSYELTPYYQKDIANLRLISPRFILMLVVTTSLLAFIGYFAPETGIGLAVFEFILGAL